MADARSTALACATEASLWADIHARAQVVAQAEPALVPMLKRYVLDRATFAEGIVRRLSERIAPTGNDVDSLVAAMQQAITADPEILAQMRADIRATLERDPATEHALIPFLWYKGFHAISLHRLAHSLWKSGRRELATHLQSLMSEHLAVDIHPAASFGVGILLDHATGFVAGETAVVGDNVSFLHEVTLGGTGKARGDRHPKIRSGVLIGAGAKILGNITVGEGAKIGAGSVVLKDVAPHTSVAGVPAVVIGRTSVDAPALDMDHSL
ncbi:serine acetyltransferase [Verrucomicrobiota bacterium]|nr:serine acetyltransferase [Verrucomicrobiota bacterium]